MNRSILTFVLHLIYCQ